jgi:hypothetical protein
MQKQENNQYFYRLEKVSIYHSLSALGVTQSVYAKIASECTRGQILNFQNTFDRVCDKIKIQTENFFV